MYLTQHLKCICHLVLPLDHGEEVKSLKEDLHVLDGFHSEAMMKKEDLLALLYVNYTYFRLQQVSHELECAPTVNDYNRR